MIQEFLRVKTLAYLFSLAFLSNVSFAEQAASESTESIDLSAVQEMPETDMAEERGGLAINYPMLPTIDLNRADLGLGKNTGIPNIGGRASPNTDFSSVNQRISDGIALIIQRGQGEQFGGDAGLSNEIQNTDAISQCPANCPLGGDGGLTPGTSGN